MIVVSDTTPLNYLILIDVIDVLPKLYGTVMIPRAVWLEMSVPLAPASVRQFVAKAPIWCQVVNVTCSDQKIAGLGTGESEAIISRGNSGQIYCLRMTGAHGERRSVWASRSPRH